VDDPSAGQASVQAPAPASRQAHVGIQRKLTEIVYSSGKPATVTYEYNKDSDRTKMTDGTGTITYTFDQLDRLT